MVSLMTSPGRITLRDVEPALRAALEREAQRRGLSLNRTALALLREATGQVGPTPSQDLHDLDDLAGTWTREQADEMDEAIREHRRIDPELWR